MAHAYTAVFSFIVSQDKRYLIFGDKITTLIDRFLKIFSPVLPKSRHTLKMMVSGLFVEFEITVNHIYDIILNTVTMRT